jgi:hypothetical protein
MARLMPLIALLVLAACSEEPPKQKPPERTVFDTMVRQEKALPARVENAQAQHQDALKKAEADSQDGH